MGQKIDQASINQETVNQFQQRLDKQLQSLKHLLAMPCFDRNQYSIGAELEVNLVNSGSLTPSPINQELLNSINHPQLQEELNKFNLEINSLPVAATSGAINTIGDEFSNFMQKITEHAQQFNARPLLIGILPTLSQQYLLPEYKTEIPRYQSLADSLLNMRGGEPFQVEIHGDESIKLQSNDVTLEGANTSLQIHLRVPASKLATIFNAAQLTTPLALAISANSPLLAGKRLWHETRIPLFKQSIDARQQHRNQWREPSRVTFGHGWLRQYPWEQFAEHIALYPPLLPKLYPEEVGEIPKLPELCLHHGTVWPWNRCVYSEHDGGHLRIEFRALPAGPTVTDMLANIAYTLGLALGYTEHMENMLYKVPFRFAEYNFYRAAQHGLNAKILWPRADSQHAVEQPIGEVIEKSLPIAEQGLKQLGLSDQEVRHYLGNIERRLGNKQNGAQWQLSCLELLQQSHDKDVALVKMLGRYLEQSNSNLPVSEWSL